MRLVRTTGHALAVIWAAAAPFAAVHVVGIVAHSVKISDETAYAIAATALAAGAVSLWRLLPNWPARLTASAAYLIIAPCVAFYYALSVACRVYHDCP